MESIGFVSGILLATAAAIWALWAASRRIDRAWAKAARRLNGTFVKGETGRSIHGMYDGCRCVVDTYTEGWGRDRVEWTRFRLFFPAGSWPVGDRRATIPAQYLRIARLMGTRDTARADEDGIEWAVPQLVETSGRILTHLRALRRAVEQYVDVRPPA